MEKRTLSKFIYVLVAITTIVMAFVFSTPFNNMVRSSKAYWYLADNLATPIMRSLDPESAHNIAVSLIKNKFAPIDVAKKPNVILQTTIWGLEFPNPIGIAAGFDKQAQAMDGLLKMGFGFVEVGGVTPEPQVGNPKPRMFRLTEDKAVINRYGLNSDGQTTVSKRLAKFRQDQSFGVIGVNIAKNTTSDNIIDDYKTGIRNLGEHVDFIVLNVSCPNVSWTKRLNQDNDELSTMICAVKAERDLLPTKPPLLLKLGPDMNEDTKEHMAEVALRCGVDGLVLSNTTSGRSTNLKSMHSTQTGGLSGAPIKEVALQTLRDMYRLTHGKIPIIGVGGIASGADAYERIRAGASLIQIYTSLVYDGPGLLPKMKRELAELLQRDGFNSVKDAVGVDAQI